MSQSKVRVGEIAFKSKSPHLDEEQEIEVNVEMEELDDEVEVVGIVDVGNDEFHNYDNMDYWTGETILVPKSSKKSASIFSGGMNLLNSIIGAGVLSLPTCVASLGLIFGSVLIVLVGALGLLCMVFIAKSAERVFDNYMQFGFLKDKKLRQAAHDYRKSMDTTRPSGEITRSDSPMSASSPRHSMDASTTPKISFDLGTSQTPNLSGSPRPSSPAPDMAIQHPADFDLEPVITFPWVTAQIAPWVQFILDIGIVTLCAGLCDAYMTLIGSNVVGIIGFFVDGPPGSDSASDSSSDGPVKYAAIRHRELWIAIAFVITLPFCCAKRLSALRYPSYFSVVCIAYLAVMVVAYFIKDFDTIFAEGYHFDLWPQSTSCLASISVIIFAYACHVNFMPIFDEAGPVDRRKRSIASGAIACGAAAVLYVLFGVFGRFIGGDNVPDSIIDGLPNHDAAVMVARFAVVFIVTCSYPLLFFAFRISVVAWTELNEKFKAKTTERFRRILVGSVGSLLITALAMAFSNLGVILSITGATGATITTFIIPGYMLWAVYPENHSCTLRHLDIPVSLGVCIFGLIFMVVAVVFTFVEV